MSEIERKEYELSQEEITDLLEAGRPVPYMIIGSYAPRSPQENANDAWRAIGKKRGFKWDTVQPVAGKPQNIISAEPDFSYDPS